MSEDGSAYVPTKAFGDGYMPLGTVYLPSNAMIIPSSQSGKCRLVLTQFASAYAISDPGVSFPIHTNPGLTSAHARVVSAE